jgi:long-chain acyl-CoA synthetase
MGGQLVVQKEFHPKDFLTALSTYQVTTFGGVPTVYAILLNQPDLKQYDLSHLTYCISGSSPMSPALLSKFEEVFHTNLLEAYGLTEATALVSTNPPRGIRKTGSVGLPYEGVRMGVVDAAGQALGDNQTGELVVSGDGVMKGYYNDPEATAQAIKKGWLYTGDLGYRDQDGYYFLVGRIKEIIIRGGVNIYPREIEEVLHTHARISQVAVLGIPDPVWGERVHACVIPVSGESLTQEELKAYLEDKIADYKIPTTLSLHNQFPQTGPGKIQKTLLKEAVLEREAN